MSVDVTVLEKVKKLMALAQDDTNEHESMKALELARKLMKNHGISMVDLKHTEDVNVEINTWESEWLSQVNTWEKYLISAVTKLFDTEALFIKTGRENKYRMRISFVGEETDLAMTIDVYYWLLKKTKSIARAMIGSGWTASHRSFAEGFGWRLYQRACQMSQEDKHSPQETQDDQKYAIILMKKEDAIEKFMSQWKIKRTKPRAHTGAFDSGAFGLGTMAGDKIDLSFKKGIGKSDGDVNRLT